MSDAPSDAPAGAAAEALLDYWFGRGDDPAEFARHQQRWFAGGEAVDRDIAERFAGLHTRAAKGELDAWAAQARGRLALILIFDQLSRNLYRSRAEAFAFDPRAFALAESGVALGLDRDLSAAERVFFLMPYQHVESLPAQERSVELFEQLAAVEAPPYVRAALEGFARYAREHRAIVARFGRFPHRNHVLGRQSTSEERSYLEGGAPTFGQ